MAFWCVFKPTKEKMVNLFYISYTLHNWHGRDLSNKQKVKFSIIPAAWVILPEKYKLFKKRGVVLMTPL